MPILLQYCKYLEEHDYDTSDMGFPEYGASTQGIDKKKIDEYNQKCDEY
jgi:hypothetical protein